MNKENYDGGQAFPRSITGLTGNLEVRSQECTGMSLRHYMAAKALQACIASGKINEHEDQKVNGCINWCYVLADKMIMAGKNHE